MKVQSFDFSVDVLKALLWRHNRAENLQEIISNKQVALDDLNEEFWTNWYSDVFNLDTANDFGLSVWSIILALPLSVDPSPSTDDNSNWGFGEFRKNYNNGNFSDAVNGVVLFTEDARTALKLRYYQLVTRGTIPECNKIVGDIFGDDGLVYALDGLDMSMTYVFDYQPNASIRFVIDKYDLLPRPSTVKLGVVYFPNSAFGFGAFRKNFNQVGNFRV